VPSGTFLIDLSPRQHHEQLPPSTFGAKKQSPDDAQKLWMFNMGYEVLPVTFCCGLLQSAAAASGLAFPALRKGACSGTRAPDLCCAH